MKKIRIYKIFDVHVQDDTRFCDQSCRFYEDDRGEAGVAWCRLVDEYGELYELAHFYKKCEHCQHETKGYLRRNLCLKGEGIA